MEKLFNDQERLSVAIITFILITLICNRGDKLSGEIRCQPLTDQRVNMRLNHGDAVLFF